MREIIILVDDHTDTEFDKTPEIVRCGNCEYWREGNGIFDFSPYCELTATKCDGEHFCSWGEKSVLRNQN